MRKLSIIGIGAGNPDHITVQATKALATVDVVFLIGKGDDKADLAQLRKDICARYITKPFRFVEAQDPERDRTPADYGAAVADWHARARGDLRAHDPRGARRKPARRVPGVGRSFALRQHAPHRRSGRSDADHQPSSST